MTIFHRSTSVLKSVWPRSIPIMHIYANIPISNFIKIIKDGYEKLNIGNIKNSLKHMFRHFKSKLIYV